MLQHACPFASAGVLPGPAPLPSLRDALARRAAIFGPVEAEPAPVASHGPWHAIRTVARRIVDMLTPARVFG